MNRQTIFDLSLLPKRKQHKMAKSNRMISTRPRVLMIGPSLTEQGGIGRVSSLIYNRLTQAKLDHISSWNNVSNSSRLPSKFSVLLHFAWAWWRLLISLWSKKVDILHCHMAERGCTLRTAVFAVTAYLFRVPVIIHTHGAEFHLFYEGLPRKLQQGLKLIFQRASSLITLSEGWQKYYIEEFELPAYKVNLLYNPVECPKDLPPKADNNPLKILFLGQVKQRKGIYDLLESLARLKHREGIAIRLVLAGDGEIEAVVRQAERLDIAQNLEVLGWIGLEEKNRRLAEADCFVLPSYNEGLPMALLEAMSYGLPVVTTPVGGIGEVVDHQKTGLLIDPGSTNQLSNALKVLLSDRDLRLRLGNSARVKAKDFAIDKYTQSLSNLYEKIAQTRRN